MSITFEIASKIVGTKGEITSVLFKALKQSDNRFYKSYGECVFSPNVKSKEFIPFSKVTDSLLVNWVNENLGVKGLKAIDKSLSDRIKKEVKSKTTTKSKD